MQACIRGSATDVQVDNKSVRYLSTKCVVGIPCLLSTRMWGGGQRLRSRDPEQEGCLRNGEGDGKGSPLPWQAFSKAEACVGGTVVQLRCRVSAGRADTGACIHLIQQ
eukprot:gene10035-biopygen2550